MLRCLRERIIRGGKQSLGLLSSSYGIIVEPEIKDEDEKIGRTDSFTETPFPQLSQFSCLDQG